MRIVAIEILDCGKLRPFPPGWREINPITAGIDMSPYRNTTDRMATLFSLCESAFLARLAFGGLTNNGVSFI